MGSNPLEGNHLKVRIGSAEISVLGGTSPYTLEDLSQLTAGFYTSIILDSNGCSTSVDFEIEEPLQIETTSTISDYGKNWTNFV